MPEQFIWPPRFTHPWVTADFQGCGGGDKLILSNALILNRTLGEAVSSKMDDMLFLKKTTNPPCALLQDPTRLLPARLRG